MTLSPLQKLLSLKYPLVVAPMAGGPTTPELVIASCEAGALGSIGAAYLNQREIEEFVTKVRAETSKPFAINLFIPSNLQKVSEQSLSFAIKKTKKFRDELNLGEPKLSPPYEENFDQQFEAVLKAKPAVFSFVFGLLSREYIIETKKRGILLAGTATTLEEARTLEESGVDAVVLQGVEAGGHRGIFDPVIDDPQISMLNLLRKSNGNLSIPLIAAGGIMSKEDIRLAFDNGADLVQMGTAFLATTESGASAPYRKRLLENLFRETELTRVFSGRLARGIKNRFMSELEKSSILPFPAQNKFTRDLRNASVKANSCEFLSLWCGAGKGELWTGSTQELIKNLFS